MVCFTCRKTFKAPLRYDRMKRDGVWEKFRYLADRRRKNHPWPLDAAGENLYRSLEKKYDRPFIKCPECGNKMANVGLDYRAPRKTDVYAWKMLKNLYVTGFHFMSCGCSGPGLIPKNREQYRAYLLDRLRVFTGHARSSTGDDSLYWNEKAELVRTELKKLPAKGAANA